MTKSNVEKGTDYEKFVQGIYQAILVAQGVQNITVQHNIELMGKSGCSHQIDVYWEFKLAGQTYKTAIECKAFDQNIPIGRIRDFYGVLLDVPNLNGVFATLVGYQSGARCYAKHYGISLQEVRAPEDSDWQGLIKDIHLNIIAVSTRITQFAPRVSQSFRSTLAPGQTMQFQWKGMSNEPFIFDPSGAIRISFEDIRRGLPSGGSTVKNQSHFVALPDHILKVDATDLPIDGVDITYDVDVSTISTSILGQELVKAVVKDVESGAVQFVDKAGAIRSPQGQ
jgi:hypothetical protein